MAVLAVVCSLVINTLACSYSDTSHWYETVSYQTPTPNSTVTYEAQLTATQMVGKVNQKVGKISVTIVLDPLNERDVTGVNAAAADMNQYLMVETFDPKGRYLPDLEIVPKGSQYRDSQQTVIAQQVDNAWNWSFKLLNGIDVTQVKTELVGSVTLDQIGPSLVSSWPQDQPIHFILPVADKYNGNQNYDVFRTPGNATLLLMPSGTLSETDATIKLARQAQQPSQPAPPSQPPQSTQPAPDLSTQPPQSGQSTSGMPTNLVVLNFNRLPDHPLSDYTTFLQNLTVGSYLNLSAADLNWGELKVNELGTTGLPKNYTAPKTVTTDLMTRLTSDQQFVNSLYYLDNTQSVEPCTKAEQLNRVIRQDPAAGSRLNGLKSKVKVVVCSQVLSQNKYLTAMYQTPTPTLTSTPRPTSTNTATITSTASITVLPSSTSVPTSTETPAASSTATLTSTSVVASTSTSAPTSTDTSAPTATASITAGPSPTPTSTLVPTPRFIEEFVTAPLGYVTSNWTIVATVVVPTLSWPGQNRYRQEIPTGEAAGNYGIKTNLTCLYGQADFSLRLSANAANHITLGWEDAAGHNGIYLTAPEILASQITTDMSYLRFNTVYQGTPYYYSYNPSLASPYDRDINLTHSANGTFFIGRMVWDSGGPSNNYMGQAKLYLDNAATPVATISDDIPGATNKVPNTTLHFFIRNDNSAATDYSWAEVDYVKLSSSNCQ